MSTQDRGRDAMAELAVRLGVPAEHTPLFLNVVDDLIWSTNLPYEPAAVALARLSRLMNSAWTDVDRLGATVVALGESCAATESEIVERACQLAPQGVLAGLTAPEALAVAASLAALGFETARCSAVGSEILAAARATANSSDTLQSFARDSGAPLGQILVQAAEVAHRAWDENTALRSAAARWKHTVSL